MLKMLVGNVLFFGIIFGWYLYTDGDRSLMLAGTVMGFGCFTSGIFMGYILHTPRKRRSPTDPALVPDFVVGEEFIPAESVQTESAAEEETHEHSDSPSVASEQVASTAGEVPAISPTNLEPEAANEPALSEVSTEIPEPPVSLNAVEQVPIAREV